MCQVPINTCICNITRSNIEDHGVLIDHVSVPSSVEFSCLGRSIIYRIHCFQGRITEAGINMNALIVILICIIILLVILLMLMFRKLQEYKKEHLEQKIEKLEDISRGPKEMFVISLERKQICHQVLS